VAVVVYSEAYVAVTRKEPGANPVNCPWTRSTAVSMADCHSADPGATPGVSVCANLLNLYNSVFAQKREE
jgi:hypothetical protein